jgi:hypothetical protein
MKEASNLSLSRFALVGFDGFPEWLGLTYRKLFEPWKLIRLEGRRFLRLKALLVVVDVFRLLALLYGKLFRMRTRSKRNEKQR